jgi:para-nitrobenzyl esterase
MASPLARGLFRGVIGESAAIFPSPTRAAAPRGKAEAAGVEFMRRVGATTLAELRAAPADAILAAAGGVGFRPIVDGWFLPRPPHEIFAAREQSDVPLMAGWNRDEGFNFGLMQGRDAKRSYVDLVRKIFHGRTEEALRRYPGGSPKAEIASAEALGGDLTIIHPTWAWIEAQKESGRAEIFRFRFDRAPLTPQGTFGERDSRDAGAFHAGEITYVFDNLDAMPWLIDDADRALARLASSYWINFVNGGDPNAPGLPRWPSYRSPEAPVMGLDTPAEARGEEWRERHLFLKRVVDGDQNSG